MTHRFFTVVLLAACSPPPKSHAPSTGSEMAFKGMRIVQYDDGDVVYRAAAKAAAGDHDRLQLTDVMVVHRGWPETGPVTLTAQRATVQPVSEAMQVEGKVTVKDSHGRTLRTEHAEYTKVPEAWVKVTGTIRIESPEMNGTAQGLEGKPELGEFHLLGPVTGTYTPSR